MHLLRRKETASMQALAEARAQVQKVKDRDPEVKAVVYRFRMHSWRLISTNS